jgi:hypothetical protein
MDLMEVIFFLSLAFIFGWLSNLVPFSIPRPFPSKAKELSGHTKVSELTLFTLVSLTTHTTNHAIPSLSSLTIQNQRCTIHLAFFFFFSRRRLPRSMIK